MSSNAPKVGLRSPRHVRGYPLHKTFLVRRFRRAATVATRWRLPRPRRHARRRGTRYEPQAAQELRAQQGIPGSLEERIFYKELLRRGFIPDVDFTFQAAKLGGRAELGGLVADFMFSNGIVVQIQSAWHEDDPEIYERDETQKAILEAVGYTVLYCHSDTVLVPSLLREWFDHVARLYGP